MEVKENMKKTTIFIILFLIILVVGIPMTYIIFEDQRPAIGEFFGGLRQSATVAFTSFSEQFMTLPYWVAIFGVICLLAGIVIDRRAWAFVLGLRKKLVTTAIQDTGIYQTSPQIQSASVTPQAQPPPPKQEIEAQ